LQPDLRGHPLTASRIANETVRRVSRPGWCPCLTPSPKAAHAPATRVTCGPPDLPSPTERGSPVNAKTTTAETVALRDAKSRHLAVTTDLQRIEQAVKPP